MLKQALVISFWSAFLCLLVSFAFMYLMPVAPATMVLSAGFQLLLFFITAGIYQVQKSSKEFTGVLLTVLIVRLLLCLVYILILRFAIAANFLSAAIHFLLVFVLFTIADIRLALKVINGK